jgi:acyl-CoA thioesterase FadM
MTFIHTPRVIASLVRGLRQRSSSNIDGIVPGKPHKYHARVGVFDVDYLGHMNNAAFLSHAEYARWEMTAANGLVQAMYKTNTHFMVSSASCRYRAEVRPLFRKFEVQSMVGGMDEKNIWMYVVLLPYSPI